MKDKFISKGKVLAVEVDNSLISPILEEIRVENVQLYTRSCIFEVNCDRQNFFLLNDRFVSPCGALMLSLKEVENSQLILSEEEMVFAVTTSDGALFEFNLTGFQSEKFWLIVSIIETGEEMPRLRLLPEKRSSCPCCQEREKCIRKECKSHPISMVLKKIVEMGLDIKIDVERPSWQFSKTLSVSNVKFSAGVAIFNRPQSGCLDLGTIHGIHLRKETLGRNIYTRLKIYDSFAEELYAISVEGEKVFSLWYEYLETQEGFRRQD